MTKKEKINELIGVFEKAKSDDDSLYRTLYEWLKSIDAIDFNYINNFDKLEGKDYGEKISHISEFSFEVCCTVLTALLRDECFIGGVFFLRHYDLLLKILGKNIS